MSLHSSIGEQFKHLEKKRKIGLLFLLIMLFFLIIYCVKVGYADTSFSTVIAAFEYYFTGKIQDPEMLSRYKIIILMRLPRIIMGILAGIGLSISGTVMQSITRNPLVSPFTIGISNAAALGAAIAIISYSRFVGKGEFVIILFSFLFSCVCAGILFKISNLLGNSSTTLVLTGIALNYFFSALSSSIKYFADDRSLSSIVHWTFGSFNGATWNQNLIIFFFISLGIFPILKFQRALEILSISDDEYVKSLGINPKFIRNITGLSSILITAGIISFTGVIGFVGVIAPHIARLFVGNNYRYLFPYSMLIGSILLIASDTIGRVIIAPTVLPVGIVTSFVGTPLFISLLLKARR